MSHSSTTRQVLYVPDARQSLSELLPRWMHDHFTTHCEPGACAGFVAFSGRTRRSASLTKERPSLAVYAIGQTTSLLLGAELFCAITDVFVPLVCTIKRIFKISVI